MLVARNKLRVARNTQLDAGNKQLAARNMMLVARNKLRWCKRGITFTGFCSRLKTELYKQAYDGHTALS